jgi:hypothetical protein
MLGGVLEWTQHKASVAPLQKHRELEARKSSALINRSSATSKNTKIDARYIYYLVLNPPSTSLQSPSRPSPIIKMLNLCLLPIQLLAAASITTAFPLNLFSRAVIAHNAVVGFPQTVPSGLNGELYLKYKPYLEVSNGCVPFPAVNAAGDTGYVLSLTLPPFRQCESLEC